MAWTDEQRAEIVKAFYEVGESAGIIAARYNVSRNAIIGLAHRHGAKVGHWSKSNAPAQRKPADAAKAQAGKATASKSPAGGAANGKAFAGLGFAAQARLDAAAAKLAAIGDQAGTIDRYRAEPVEGARFVPWDALDKGECQFAVTPHSVGPTEHRFCGLPADGSYCPHHRRLARI